MEFLFYPMRHGQPNSSYHVPIVKAKSKGTNAAKFAFSQKKLLFRMACGTGMHCGSHFAAGPYGQHQPFANVFFSAIYSQMRNNACETTVPGSRQRRVPVESPDTSVQDLASTNLIFAVGTGE